MQRLGILRESGHEHFRGSLVVPVFGEGGEVLEIYGRKVGERLRRGTPAHLYLPGPHRGVWNREALASSSEIILCESLIDAMTFWCAGLRNVTAAYGVNGFTDEHLDVFRACGVRRVLVAYDRDAAGDQAAAALVPVLSAAGIASARIQFPRGLDANEYAGKVQPASKSLAVLVEQAGWLADGAEPDAAVDEAAKEKGARPSLAAVAADAESAAARAPGAESARADADVLTEVPHEVEGDEVWLTLGDRRYRVRGLQKNTTADALRVNLLVRRGEGLHVDTLDLYAARQRGAYAAQAAGELGVKDAVVKKDLGRVLLALEALQEERLRRAAEEPGRKRAELSEAEREEALALLRSPDLLSRILEDFERSGVVGEEVNKLVGYVAAVSRKLERPLAIIVQSASAAGKTSLMDAVLAFVPEEERVQYSALTGQSLFYMEGLDLRHKVLAVVEEEGAERASYALKLLQSEGELTIASTGKDPETGRLVTHEYRVEGPVMIFLTTTAVEIDEELLNRSVVLTVDEGREQTRRVHEAQRRRRTLEGLLARQEKEEVLRLHRNAQRLLRPLAVVNPYAPHLTFLDSRTRTRRDHEKYLTLIDAIALLHQHQREVKRVERGERRIEYIEVTLEDIEAANRLADAVLGRSLDELPPQTRAFLEGLYEWREARREESGRDGEPVGFTAREAREALGLGASQTKVHLARLVELEYLLVRRGEHGRHVYELLYGGEGRDGAPFLAGLLDVTELRRRHGREYGADRPDSGGRRPDDEALRPEGGRGTAGPGPGAGRSGGRASKSGRGNDFDAPGPNGRGSASLKRPARVAPYVPSGNGARP